MEETQQSVKAGSEGRDFQAPKVIVVEDNEHQPIENKRVDVLVFTEGDRHRASPEGVGPGNG